jgi:hypothetical protein
MVVLMAGRRSLLLACDISADHQEEPWERLLQEIHLLMARASKRLKFEETTGKAN